jgi:two-component system chemotaxis sensor kinase CheA
MDIWKYFNIEKSDSRSYYLVVVQHKGHYQAFCVDRIVGQQDVVVKGLEECLFNPPGISGATILGNGRVVLILDVPALVMMNLEKKGRAGRREGEGGPILEEASAREVSISTT